MPTDTVLDPYTHDAVLEAGVVGSPGPYRGETVKAHVSLREGFSTRPHELIDFIRARMAAHEYPREILRRSLRASVDGVRDCVTDVFEAGPAAPDPRDDWAPSRGVLMSYAYLGSQPQAIDRTHAQNVLRLREDLRTSAGAVTAAPLAIAMLDAAVVNVESLHVRAVTQVDVTIVDCALDVERVLLSGAITAEGRSQLFTEARISDADHPERRIGFGSANWAVVGTTPQRFCFPEPAAAVAGRGVLPPLWHAYSARRRFDGLLEIPRLQDVGAERLHHAPMLVVAEAVALEHAAETLGSDQLTVDSLNMTLVAPGRVGPFIASPVFSAVDTETVGCRVELRDVGCDDCVVGAAFVRMQAY